MIGVATIGGRINNPTAPQVVTTPAQRRNTAAAPDALLRFAGSLAVSAPLIQKAPAPIPAAAAHRRRFQPPAARRPCLDQPLSG
jgi:hypothetical protein